MAISLSDEPKTISLIRLNKAATLGEMGRTDEAVEIFMQEKDRQESAYEKFTWNDNLGYIYSFSDPRKALYYYQQADRFMDNGITYKDRKVRYYCRMARVSANNKFRQRQLIDKAIGLTINGFSSDRERAAALTELAVFNSSIFNYEEAHRLFLQAFELYSGLDAADRRLPYLRRNYAANLGRLGQAKEARKILEAELASAKKTYGKNHPDYLSTLSELILLGCNYPKIGIKTEKLYKEYCKLTDQSDLMTNLAILRLRNDFSGAKSMIEEALIGGQEPPEVLLLCQAYEEICRENMTSEEYQCAISSLIPRIKNAIISGTLSLAGSEENSLQSPLNDIIDGMILKGACAPALELTLFRKGLLFSKRAEIKKIPGHTPEFDQLQETKRRLQAAIAYNDSTHIPILASDALSLERELSYQISRSNEIYERLDRRPESVCSALKANDIAAEFVKYSANGIARYGVFLISPSGAIEFRDLASEAEIQKNPRLVWTWLQNSGQTFDDLYFCPDGILTNIPIEYLTVNQLTRPHRVSHLSELHPPMGIGSHIALVGVSDHNSPVGQGSSVCRGSWVDLPNVEYELQLIGESLADMNPLIYFNDEANEPAIKNLPAAEISTLHFSTHGFYRNNEALTRAAESPADDDFHIARRFLTAGNQEISGLVLRQGNLSWKAPYILDEEDDLLTNNEIELLDFPNLRLVVLSACETALGSIDFDGIRGLQRAFRAAGAHSIICSLYKIDDYWTSQFMAAFYEQAAQGNSIYDSFHSARQWLQRELPDYPEIWSAFLLIE